MNLKTSHRITGRDHDAPLRIVIAGGGTGGHLFPAIAVADEFVSRNRHNRILFVGTGNLLERSVLSKTDYLFATIRAEGIKGRGLLRQARAILKVMPGIWASVSILRRFRPDLVIGVGGYSAGPLVMGAWLLKISIVLHEQNRLPGITNRILARFAQRIFVSFDDMGSCFDPRKTAVTGNPVRKEILEAARQRPSRAGGPGTCSPFRILVVGGSQGATAINRAVVEALDYLGDPKNAFHFVHQAGPQDIRAVDTAYAHHGVPKTVKSFFDDISHQYQQADLVICRAGATTIAEITAIGKAAIFIPFPFAADDHQTINASALSDRGAAETISQQDLTGGLLAERIAFYAKNPDALARMAAAAKAFGKPEAARLIVDRCYDLLQTAGTQGGGIRHNG